MTSLIYSCLSSIEDCTSYLCHRYSLFRGWFIQTNLAIMGEKKVKRHVRSPRRFPPLNKSNEGYCSTHCFYFIGVVTGCGAVLMGLSLNISLEQGKLVKKYLDPTPLLRNPKL